ncbi:MAG TPA: hypothetical protein VGG18_05310 [Granulicella sp.]
MMEVVAECSGVAYGGSGASGSSLWVAAAFVETARRRCLAASSIAFYFTLHSRVLNRAGTSSPGIGQRTIVAVSMLLWPGVGVAGRAIGLI